MPLGKLLLQMSLPMMISMFVQSLYNIVDSIFVAQISEHALTAVSLAFPIQNLTEIMSGMCISGIVITGLQEFDYDIGTGFSALDHHGFPLSMIIRGQKTAE